MNQETGCYHILMVVYRRRWWFGKKVYVVRCFECDYCSPEFKTRGEANSLVQHMESYAVA